MKSFKVSAVRSVYSIVYWGKNLSAGDLFTFLSKDTPSILKESNIASADDVYKFVNCFIDNFHNEISSDNNPITKKGARTIIENYYLIKNEILFV